MKLKILILFLLLFLSCSSLAMKEDSFIYGSWLIIKIDGLSCNVCPLIIFAKSGKGTIRKPSKETIPFNFIFFSKSKKILFSIDDKQPYFEEKEYSYKSYYENNLEILELSSKSEDVKYILSRIK
jgi:hypothetical protein